ncbi:MAG: LemA family protein [Alphaproteobacteria bacterium]|nr:LemA family protein [Alphaproteobacteria bacterium]
MFLYVFITVGIAAVLVVLGYNRGVSYRNYVQEAFSTMDVYLKKRWDLIPNLVETVKNYTAHEKSLLTDLSELRTRGYNDLSDAEKINTNLQIGKVLPQIIAVAENYPELKANQNYVQLMEQMSLVEDEIANARKYYNGTVREYNTFLDLFPTSIIGRIFGMKHAVLFEITSQQRENITIEE